MHTQMRHSLERGPLSYYTWPQHTRRTAPSQEVTCIKGGYFHFWTLRDGGLRRGEL